MAGHENQLTFEGFRTYLMGSAIIAHHLVKQFLGVDFPEGLWSNMVDVGLGVGVLYYRWKAQQILNRALKEAAHVQSPS